MERGYIKLYRSLLDHPIWLHEPFTRAQAWLDLLMLANHKPGIIRPRGIRIEIQRGQVAWSKVTLARRWQWKSRGKISRFLNELEMDQQIVQQQNNLTTVITIINYEKYQSNGQQMLQQTDSRRTADGQQTDTNKNVKNDKKVKKEYITPLLGEHKNVKITESELVSLTEYVGSKDRALDLIERLSSYMASKNKHYANHYATMQTWHRKDKTENKVTGIVATASKEYI